MNNYFRQQVNGQLSLTHNYLPKPDRDTEIFIKNIPKDATIEEVFQFVQRSGTVYQIRLLMEFSGNNRGYCFVTYLNTAESRRAICTLNSMEIRPNRWVNVTISVDNNKLVIHGIPKNISTPAMRDALSKLFTFKNLIPLNCKFDHHLNFIIQFSTHQEALEVRKKYWPRITLFGHKYSLDWAIPDSVVKATHLYFWKASTFHTKEELLHELFKHVETSSVVNIYKRQAIGRILFKDYYSAKQALTNLKGKKILGSAMRWSLEHESGPEHDEEDLYMENKISMLESQCQITDEATSTVISTATRRFNVKVYYRVLDGTLRKWDVLSQVKLHVDMDNLVDIFHCKTSGYLEFKTPEAAHSAYSTLKYASPYLDGKVLQFSDRDYGYLMVSTQPRQQPQLELKAQLNDQDSTTDLQGTQLPGTSYQYKKSYRDAVASSPSKSSSYLCSRCGNLTIKNLLAATMSPSRWRNPYSNTEVTSNLCDVCLDKGTYSNLTSKFWKPNGQNIDVPQMPQQAAGTGEGRSNEGIWRTTENDIPIIPGLQDENRDFNLPSTSTYEPPSSIISWTLTSQGWWASQEKEVPRSTPERAPNEPSCCCSNAFLPEEPILQLTLEDQYKLESYENYLQELDVLFNGENDAIPTEVIRSRVKFIIKNLMSLMMEKGSKIYQARTNL